MIAITPPIASTTTSSAMAHPTGYAWSRRRCRPGERDRLFHHQSAARGLLVVFVEELIAARLLCLDLDGGVLARGNHLLDLQRVAFKLHRVLVEVAEFDHDRRI